MKKTLLNTLIVLLTIGYARAADYYTKSASATLSGNSALSANWTTNPDGTTGLTSVTILASDNIHIMDGAVVTLNAEPTATNGVAMIVNNVTAGNGSTTSVDPYGTLDLQAFVLQINGNLTGRILRKGIARVAATGVFATTGTLNITGGNGKSLSFKEVIGSTTGLLSSRSNIYLMGDNQLAGNTEILGSIRMNTGANLDLNGKSLTACSIICPSSTDGMYANNGSISINLGTFLNGGSQSGSQLWFVAGDQSRPNILKSLSYTNSSNASQTNDVNIRSSVEVQDISIDQPNGSATIRLNENTATLTVTGVYTIKGNSSTRGLYTSTASVNHGVVLDRKILFKTGSEIVVDKSSIKPFHKIVTSGIYYSAADKTAGTTTTNLNTNNIEFESGVKFKIANWDGTTIQPSITVIDGGTITGTITSNNVILPASLTATAALNGTAPAQQLAIAIDGVLPVKLTSFTAKALAGGVNLSWTTESEDALKDFVVERSIDGNDFTAVDTRAAVGSGANAYSLVDAAPLNGDNYYRLKSVDHNGSFSLSEIRVVSVGINGANELRLYPNPVVGSTLTVNYPSINVPGVINIYNLIGESVGSYSAQAGNSTILNVSELSPGVYILKVTAKGKTNTIKFLKN